MLANLLEISCSVVKGLARFVHGVVGTVVASGMLGGNRKQRESVSTSTVVLARETDC